MARVVLVLLGIVGLLPLSVGLLAHTELARTWATRLARDALRRELDVDATFQARVSVLPPSVVVEDLTVPSTDGGGPALTAARARVRPRVFALLTGRLDAGALELEAPRVRLVVDGDRVTNVRYKLPPKKPSPAGSKPPTHRVPLHALTVADAEVDVSLVGPRVRFSGTRLDLELTAKDGPEVIAKLSLGRASVTRTHADGVDQDAICSLVVEGSWKDGVGSVSRVELAARPSRFGEPAPTCDGEIGPDRAFSLAFTDGTVREGPDLPKVTGHLALHVPARLVERVKGAGPPVFSGFADLDLDVSHPGTLELPEAGGTLDVTELRVFDGSMSHVIVHALHGTLATTAREARLVEATALWGGATCHLRNAWVRPLDPGLPGEVESVEARGLKFPEVIRDIGITEHTIVKWDLDHVVVRNYRGNILDPVRGGPVLMGDIQGTTSNFEVGDRGWDDPARKRVVSVAKANLKGRFGVEPDGILFRSMTADFGHSHLDVPVVTIGFKDLLDIRAAGGTRVDLADLSPIASLPVAGVVEPRVLVHGGQAHPRIDADLSGRGIKLSNLPLADAVTGKASFVPFILEFTDLRAHKGRSSYDLSKVRVDLERASGIAVTADAQGKDLDARDLLAMLLFDKDPRLEEIHGTGALRVHLEFESGTPRDVCKTGLFDIRASAVMGNMLLYGERYDSGTAEVAYTFFDLDAGENGSDVVVPSLTLKKGAGTITGSGELTRGGEVRGHFEAHGVPLSHVDAMGALGPMVDGSAALVGEVSGRVDELAMNATVTLSPVRIGQAVLPESQLSVTLVPEAKRRPEHPRLSRVCKDVVPEPFDRAAFDRDGPVGVFHTKGALFGGQIKLRDVTTTRQTHKRVGGELVFDRFELGAAFQLSPAFVTSDSPPTGVLSGVLSLGSLELDHLDRAEATMRLSGLSVRRGRAGVDLRVDDDKGREVRLSGDKVTFAPLKLDVRAPSGQGGSIEVEGSVAKVSKTRELDVTARFGPVDLAMLPSLVPRLDAAAGKVSAVFAAKGPAKSPSITGELRLTDGELSVRGVPLAIEGANVVATVGHGEIRIERGEARAGGGTVTLTGRAPLVGLELGEARVGLVAKGVRIPFATGVEATLGADITATLPRDSDRHGRARVTGELSVDGFLYTKPIGLAVNLDKLAKNRRTEVTVYDPADDFVDIELRVRADKPLVFRNNLLDARLKVEDSLVLSGTNQRQGLVGTLVVVQGGRLRLRANEFDITQGTIRFDDTTRVAPHVDLRAVTDYRRYTSSTTAGGPSGAVASGARAGGSWRILMRAHGDADNVKLDLSSEPSLAQDDIVLLLAVGMTRAELDQLQAANLGGAAAIEALSALSGADSAVKNVIPILDDFRLGSAYSTRTGRTEPTVQVGKRLGARVRASVITGLSESRDVRSNVEWKLGDRTSILGNYDNLNDVTSQGLGNLGADFRVRLEF